MSVDRRISASLELAAEDARAASVLAQAGNRYAAYHVQQAIEKLLKAVLLHSGVEAGVEHRLEVLLGRLPPASPWRSRIEPLKPYSAYATAYRYPTSGGRILPSRDASLLAADIAAVDELLAIAREELR